MPWAELFFSVITELGSDYFYVALIAVGFWVVDKRASTLTAFVLVISVVSNYWLKITFKNSLIEGLTQAKLPLYCQVVAPLDCLS